MTMSNVKWVVHAEPVGVSLSKGSELATIDKAQAVE